MKPEKFTDILVNSGFAPFMGVPCSVFKHLMNYIQATENISYYPATSEGEALGLAGGFALAGKMPVVIMQVDGYGNAVNPISSLQLLYKLPCLLLISWRGEPGRKDAPQHLVMGGAIKKLLYAFDIPCVVPEDDRDSLYSTVEAARKHGKIYSTPYAFLIRKGYFETFNGIEINADSTLDVRAEYIEALRSLSGAYDIFIGTTGYCGREMHRILKEKKCFYMMGSMGCALSIGLALSIQKPKRTVFVLDGDGALMMKMGTLATVGSLAPGNLVHVCFDNQQYESTGGQKSVSENIDFSKIADGCGYRTAKTVESLLDFTGTVKKDLALKGPHFIHVKIRPGAMEGLPRPTESPEKMKWDFLAGSNEPSDVEGR